MLLSNVNVVGFSDMLKFILFLSLFMVLFTVGSGDAFANPIPTPDPPSVEGELSKKICDIRRLFCPSKGGFVLVAFAVFFAGMLVIGGKMHWTVLLLVAVGIGIFSRAEKVPKLMTVNEVQLHGSCDCSSGFFDGF